MRKLTATLCLSIAVIAGHIGTCWAQNTNGNEIATLYRDSVMIENARIHIATFNSSIKAAGGGSFAYNWGNCMIAAKLFQSQEHTKTRFWCEKGSYKK